MKHGQQDWREGIVVFILKADWIGGHGFIHPDDGGKDVMYHINRAWRLERTEERLRPRKIDRNIDHLPCVGERIIFIAGEGQKGLRTVVWGYAEDLKLVIT